MDTISVNSVLDGKTWKVAVVKGAKKQFERGKCWTAYCGNPIWFVHLNCHEKADFGTCFCCAELRSLWNFIRKMPRRGRFVIPKKGKPVEWRFNEKTSQFSPIKQ